MQRATIQQCLSADNFSLQSAIPMVLRAQGSAGHLPKPNHTTQQQHTVVMCFYLSLLCTPRYCNIQPGPCTAGQAVQDQQASISSASTTSAALRHLRPEKTHFARHYHRVASYHTMSLHTVPHDEASHVCLVKTQTSFKLVLLTLHQI